MATGDLKNNLRILTSELKRLEVSSGIYNLAEMSVGNADAYLDLFNNVLQWHHGRLTGAINRKGLKPPPREENNTKFLEGVYRIFREMFNWKPPLTVSQFLSSGFHEKKVIMCTEMIRLIIQKKHEISPPAARKQNLDTGHSGLKMILKQPKNFAPPLKEKDMNKSMPETSSAKYGLRKDESSIWQFKRSEASSSAYVSPYAGNNTVPTYRENRYADGVFVDRILSELLDFKTVVLGKFESLESRLSATEKRINILEITLNSLREEKNN